MPISFLNPAQRENYGRYAASPTPDQLSRFFHLSDDDLREIRSCRSEHNRLGFALQLSTVRYLGTFLDDPVAVPAEVVQTLAHQLETVNSDALRMDFPSRCSKDPKDGCCEPSPRAGKSGPGSPPKPCI